MLSHVLNVFASPLSMTLVFLLVAIFLFIQNKIRMDAIALLVMLAFSLSGILTIPEVFAGFSDPNIILIGLLFVIGESLSRTGVAYGVSEWLISRAKNSETRVIILLMTAVAILGAFMSSTGIVAIFIPVVLVIGQKMGISPKRLMMPLSMAGLISGMMTLIATAPNLIVNAELVRISHQRLNFFSFTPFGIVILVMGIIYMLLVRNWLGPNNIDQQDGSNRFSIQDLIDDYELNQRAKLVVVRAGSDFIGKSIESLHLRSKFGINIIAIERWKRLRANFMVTDIGKVEIKEKDILLIDISDPDLDLNIMCQAHHLEPAPLRKQSFNQKASLLGMVEITPVPNSNTIGKSIKEITFRTQYGLNIIGIKRNNEILVGNLVDEPLKMGDLLLVIGSWKLIQNMRNKTKSFFVLDYPSEIQQAAPAKKQAPYALLSIIIMVGLMVSGMVPNVVAALIACLLLAQFKCIDAKSAYNSVQWSSLILIIGMMPFSIALQKTGGVDLAVHHLLAIAGGWGSYALLMGLFVVCAIVGLFISNTATAVLMSPIAIAIADQLNLSPIPFAMVVAIAASSAFMTPISSPVNTMVLGLGNYKFSDFVKIGVPFTILVMLVTVFLVPLLFPLGIHN